MTVLEVNEISGGQNTVVEFHIWNRFSGWRSFINLTSSYEGKRMDYCDSGHNWNLWGGFKFRCDPVPCPDGTRCYNPETSYPIWIQFLKVLDVRQFF